METALQTYLSFLAADVRDRAVNSYRKTSPPRSTPYEAETVALEKQLKVTRITRPLKLWLQEENVLQGQPLQPLGHAQQLFQVHQKKGEVLT